jgi:hypothetical protein
MFRRVTREADELLFHYDGSRRRPEITLVASTLSGRSAADDDVPLFTLVRATVGLPMDDRRWWPEGRRARRDPHAPRVLTWGGPALVDASPGRHVAVARGTTLSAPAFARPTVDLLERTLAALRDY